MEPTDLTNPMDDCTTVQAARLLGVSVRSVQLMVDRGELAAWKTSGGHRRIARASVDRWRHSRSSGGQAPAATGLTGLPVSAEHAPALTAVARPCALLIDDSNHFQKLVTLVFQQRFPGVELHVADDGISGLAQYGRLQPDFLIVDILLPGIDGATLITSLRSHAQFSPSHLVVVTSLDTSELAPYALALEGIPVIHKSRLVAELSALMQSWLGESRDLPSDRRPQSSASASR